MPDRISALTDAELRRRLAAEGVFLRIAPFVFHISSPIALVAHGLHTLYRDYEWLPGDDVFADFHVAVLPQRRFFKPLCVFQFDGFQPFTPLALGEAYAFLEWGMNWCVTSHCHHWLMIHAAVLEKNGRALIMPAPPGSGKSTLCAALMLQGWRLLSDEMALLDLSSGLIVPAPRPVSLKNQSIDLIRRGWSSAVLGPLAHDTMKGTVAHLRPTASALAQSRLAVPPAWVVFPQFLATRAALSARPRPKAAALLELASNSFNQHVHGRAGFAALVELIDRSDCFDFSYSQLDQALVWFDALEPPP